MIAGHMIVKKSVNKVFESMEEGTLVEYKNVATGDDHCRAFFVRALGGDRSQALLKEEKREAYILVSYCYINEKPPPEFKYFRLVIEQGCQPILVSSWLKSDVDKMNVFYVSPIIEVKASLL